MQWRCHLQCKTGSIPHSPSAAHVLISLCRQVRLPLLPFTPQPTAIWLPLLNTPWKSLWPKSIMTALLLNSMDIFLSSSYPTARQDLTWLTTLSPSWKFLLPWFLWQLLLQDFLLSVHCFSVYPKGGGVCCYSSHFKLVITRNLS